MDQGRDLIAEGLAASCRQDDKGVSLFQEMSDDGLLQGPEVIVAENVFENGFRPGHPFTHYDLALFPSSRAFR